MKTFDIYKYIGFFSKEIVENLVKCLFKNVHDMFSECACLHDMFFHEGL